MGAGTIAERKAYILSGRSVERVSCYHAWERDAESNTIVLQEDPDDTDTGVLCDSAYWLSAERDHTSGVLIEKIPCT